MKLRLTNGETINVEFWSFVKCHALAGLTLSGILWILIICAITLNKAIGRV